MVRKILHMIRESVISGNKTSSARIIAYIFVLLITSLVVSIIVLSFLSMVIPPEIVSVLIALKSSMLILVGVTKYYQKK